MVRSLLVLTVLSLYCFVGFSCEEANKTGGEAAVKSGYETRYDNIDLDELLKNDRLRKNYVKCLLNEGPCTPDGQELKSKSHFSTNPFRIITERITTLKDFLVRLTSRRNSHQLLKMYGEAKKWVSQSHPLHYRQSSR